MSRTTRILATAALLPAVASTALAPSAAARVSIVPGEVPGGGTETLAIRVASQKPGVPTTALRLELPDDVAVDRLGSAPVDGWTTVVEGVHAVNWSGGEIGAGTFEQFLLTVGTLPDEGRLAFTAVQTYADGTTERWEAAVDGPAVLIGAEPGAAPTQPSPSRPSPTPTMVVTRTDGMTPAAGAEVTSELDPAVAALVGLVPLVGGAALVAGMRRRSRTAAGVPADDPAPTAPQAAVPDDPDGPDAGLELFERAFAEVAATTGRPTGRHHRTPEREAEMFSDPDATDVLPRIELADLADLADIEATRPLERVLR